MSVVLDASAILAFLQDEPGTDVVEASMAQGPMCAAANWPEVAQKALAACRDWDLVRALLVSYEVSVEAVTADDADRTDATWGSDGRIRQIH